MSETQPSRIAILGAGQLALMLAEAAKTLLVEVSCAGQESDCASRVAKVITVDLEDASEVANFAKSSDVVTIETENIDISIVEGLPLAPNARAIGIAQDRLAEKLFLQSCGISCAPFRSVDSVQDLRSAVQELGFPAILKTRRMGYDGKGQKRIYSDGDLDGAFEDLGKVPCVLEGVVRFDAEVSLIAARSRTGEIVFYPLIENVHREGILRRSTVPFAGVTNAMQSQAEGYLKRTLEELEYVGVLAVEFFVVGGKLVANEMAPRVHNSGHWTIEGSKTSQFENHLRAILGMKLGSTDSVPTVMLNCIGKMPSAAETATTPAVWRHDYGKTARPGRKVGHLTLPGSQHEAIERWYLLLNPEE
ncbi:5-(carboxyamino)imidazole ribonucleotide synthase [Granulicella sp. 5B5]|uniref:5-(carboxyamino)imidazole ribonucleotide synthase n=1 Tax=Granulicella sp. 5B5 TaxID=1617967 RepID=UPI0015F541E9|nr:5-(carboxyamino)imidazole ribonucleotide synthase [Granulicella sp. 5B5]QMV17539.1 5-(carboxyamino)imidazole ribonucleotide synthase [Granulicella sp. 5B5]